ncbi:3-oxo-5-alpha-steroid 4-dehydrogenase 2 isoform X1 [Hippocampus comes]|uniref:3-oxo-5-alpha-steroid 4-dehydrogenase 2 isoform X1 n=2 Tax=Hippocampus comes TaxID=109280 RepID=UPI00094ED5B5|nr:PREDICTED: 3-oxo-5-alpha-steroid 4-dehydrogenase 2 isoform X1 [Hippocampus comes]XP_019726265.1 PREDICTED: 3-oxo-5-alpha-steroid 4-dehydrogenase 2 isoform X1 [Hippocampus comes]
MYCNQDLLNYLSFGMVLAGLWHLYRHKKIQTCYGRHMMQTSPTRLVPARLAWFIQELPAILIPLLLMLTSHKPYSVGKMLLLGTFCLHYFYRTFIYSFLVRGQPYPLNAMVGAIFFTSINGFLQGYYLLHCAQLNEWKTDCRLKIGLLLFYTGMAINIHSDYCLRNLRKSGEVIYKVPKGGLFEYVSAPNYLGEIVEWFGYAMATWGFPSLSFAVFTTCFIGPRAIYHHRFYNKKFKSYSKSRKALIPFLL